MKSSCEGACGLGLRLAVVSIAFSGDVRSITADRNFGFPSRPSFSSLDPSTLLDCNFFQDLPTPLGRRSSSSLASSLTIKSLSSSSAPFSSSFSASLFPSCCNAVLRSSAKALKSTFGAALRFGVSLTPLPFPFFSISTTDTAACSFLGDLMGAAFECSVGRRSEFTCASRRGFWSRAWLSLEAVSRTFSESDKGVVMFLADSSSVFLVLCTGVVHCAFRGEERLVWTSRGLLRAAFKRVERSGSSSSSSLASCSLAMIVPVLEVAVGRRLSRC